jgi:glycosyltransferase involved in cell wall biosynthesis
MQDGNSLKKQKTSSIEILYVGTLEARKGFVDLIESVKILRKERYDIVLTLVGKHSRYSKWIINKESENITDGWLKVIGALPRENLKQYYHSADICCFPSWFENAPIVCLEAMACGSIVIGSSNSGMAEVIRDGIDGFLVEPKNPKTLAECIKKVMHLSEHQKEEMRQKAKKRILENYDNSVLIPQMTEVYKDVIAGFRIVQ